MSFRVDGDGYIQYKAMVISSSMHLLLLMFELLACDKLESGRHKWTLVFIPLMFMSVASIGICVWAVKHERSFEVSLVISGSFWKDRNVPFFKTECVESGLIVLSPIIPYLRPTTAYLFPTTPFLDLISLGRSHHIISVPHFHPTFITAFPVLITPLPVPTLPCHPPTLHLLIPATHSLVLILAFLFFHLISQLSSFHIMVSLTL